MKIVVFGDGGVGKSALVIKLVSGEFLEEYDPTIEDSHRKVFSCHGTPVMLDILDTAGREEVFCLRDQLIREGQFFIICFSLSVDAAQPSGNSIYNSQSKYPFRYAVVKSMLCNFRLCLAAVASSILNDDSANTGAYELK